VGHLLPGSDYLIEAHANPRAHHSHLGEPGSLASATPVVDDFAHLIAHKAGRIKSGEQGALHLDDVVGGLIGV
jgi:hypothetical protein